VISPEQAEPLLAEGHVFAAAVHTPATQMYALEQFADEVHKVEAPPTTVDAISSCSI
jgi:hypothetical protein